MALSKGKLKNDTLPHSQCSDMECLRICVHYRPNHTPGTKSGVGACVRPARQSRDCLRGRPLRAPPLFAAVRLALEIGTAHRFASTQQRDVFLKVNVTIPLGG